MKAILLIGSGGFIGSVLRYLVTRFILTHFESSFPFGTFVVNLLGCLLIGVLFGLSFRADWLDPNWRLFLMVGVCGGFTTFSSFSLESLQLLNTGHFFGFALYTGLSVMVGLLFTYLGMQIASLK